MKLRTIVATAAVVLAVVNTGRADFALTGIEHLDVTSSHSVGVLWDSSTADVKPAGYIAEAYVEDDAQLTISGGHVANYLRAYKMSSVTVSSGNVGWLYAYDTSDVTISDGSFTSVYAWNTNKVTISGGNISSLLSAWDASHVTISGGNVNRVDARGNSSITFYGTDFRAAGGLTLDGDTVLGTGLLTGEWFDGTSWFIPIGDHEPGATIRVIPEPMTLVLLALGGLAVVERRPRVRR